MLAKFVLAVAPPTLWVAAIFAMAASYPAAAGVYVADKLQFELPLEKRVEVQPRYFTQIPLNAPPGSVLDIKVSVHNAVFNDLNVFVCDEGSLARFARQQPNGCRGVNKGHGVIQFRYAVQGPEPHYLLLDNTYAMMVKKKVSVAVHATVPVPPDLKEQLRESFTAAQRMISETFAVPEFDFALKPCGQVNAYSGGRRGDITICSELFLGFLAKGLRGAIEAVLFHELAHTLLNVWGLPNYDNEETADEFALVMLFWQGQQQAALDWIKYFSTHDPHAEAAHKIQHGGRHPLSIQRIRNIERILSNPRPVVERWNRLVYPYLSDEGLRAIVGRPGNYGDRELARSELMKRSN